MLRGSEKVVEQLKLRAGLGRTKSGEYCSDPIDQSKSAYSKHIPDL